MTFIWIVDIGFLIFGIYVFSRKKHAHFDLEGRVYRMIYNLTGFSAIAYACFNLVYHIFLREHVWEWGYDDHFLYIQSFCRHVIVGFAIIFTSVNNEIAKRGKEE